MRLQPVNQRIIVQRRDAQEKLSEGGVILPVEAQKRSNTAVIRAVGEDITDYSVGDMVLLSDTAGIPISWDDEVLLIVSTREILAKVKE